MLLPWMWALRRKVNSGRTLSVARQRSTRALWRYGRTWSVTRRKTSTPAMRDESCGSSMWGSAGVKVVLWARSPITSVMTVPAAPQEKLHQGQGQPPDPYFQEIQNALPVRKASFYGWTAPFNRKWLLGWSRKITVFYCGDTKRFPRKPCFWPWPMT